MSDDINKRIVEYMTSGFSVIDIYATLEKEGYSKDEIIMGVNEGVKFYKNVANYDKNAMIGLSIHRLETIILNLFKIQDFKGALQAQKELNNLILKKEDVENHRAEKKEDGFFNIL